MLLTYEQCLKKYKNNYQMEKAISRGDLFKLEKGIYSDKKYESELAIISLRYSKAIFTLNSAFYYYGLTDTIPEKYYLQTDSHAKVINDSRIYQLFDNSKILETGITEMDQDGVKIRIYDKERLLLELLRHKKKLPFDYYKEIITSYRRMSYELDFQKIQDYIKNMPKTKMIMEALQMEVL